MRVEKSPGGGVKLISEASLARRLLIGVPLVLLFLAGLLALQVHVVGGDWGYGAAGLGLVIAMTIFGRIVGGRIDRRRDRRFQRYRNL